MYIEELCLKNYRNYGDYRASLNKGLNIIVGKNAVGKTNLLEAIYFLENGRSHRTNNHKELINWNSDFTTIKASIHRVERELKVEATILRDGGRQLKINGVSQKSSRGKIRPIGAVIFTPDHLKIVKEAPEHRRAYIDEILEKVKSDHYYWRQQYSKVLRQRNMLLKKVYTGRMKDDVIEYWDKQLITAGVKLILARKIIIEKLEANAGQAYKKISDQETDFSLKYENQLLIEDNSLDTLEIRFKEKLKKRRQDEIERGLTLTGPHRDDVGIFVGEIDIRTFGSQGEQRSASLALKMAELEIITQIVKEKPLLLLDDVMSELDEERRGALLDNINNGTQTIITSTNMVYFKESDISGANIIEIGH